MFWAICKKAGAFFTMSFTLSAFAINAPDYYEASQNPPSSCMVHYSGGAGRLCSGDIVGKDKLLTAAHCAVKDYETAIVRCANQKSQRDLLVMGQLIHPLFSGLPSPFDHALLQTESGFLNFETRRAPLPQNDDEIYTLLEEECAVFGYGLNNVQEYGTLLGASVFAEPNFSLGFEVMLMSGFPTVEEGDSGGGLFCRASPKSQWARIATLSRARSLNGERIATAAPLKQPIINWIKRSLKEEDLPRLSNFQETVPLKTAPPEAMETAEECVLRLAQTSASHSTDQREQLLKEEALYQCGLTISQESLNSLLEKYPEDYTEIYTVDEAHGFYKEQTVYYTQGHRWVDVTHSADFDRDKCSINSGFRLKTIGFSQDKQSALVEALDFTPGARCSTGDQFILPMKFLSDTQPEEFIPNDYSKADPLGRAGDFIKIKQ